MPTKTTPNRVGVTIRRLRFERGLTVAALAERSGVSRRALTYIESGHTTPQTSTTKAVAAALGVSVSELTGGEQ